jgi:pimeloyl-ACP methyl ester carboxylesterase
MSRISHTPSDAAAAVGKPGASFEHGTVEVFGHSVGFASAGTGEDVLIICPGSAGADGSWAKDMLAQKMRVVELNPPGWGTTVSLDYRIDQRELALVLAAAIGELGIARYHLHGASMGGVTALWLATHYPERVATISFEGGMNFVREENLVSPQNVRVLQEMVARNDPEGSGYPRAAPHPRKPWSDDDYVRGQMRKRISMMRMLSNRHEAELVARMNDFQIPALVLLGEEDELLKPNHLERWKQICPAARTLLIPGAAHDIQNTEPEQLVEALTRFHAEAAQ